MVRALFFDEKYFSLTTPVDENTNYKLIQPVIWDCQELYIQDILGTPLYDELKNQVENSTITVLNTTLLNRYVVPCLLNYTVMESQLNLMYKMRNRSVMTDRSDYSDPIDFVTVRSIRDEFRTKAEKYAQKIQDYLCANIDDYPLYKTYTTSDQVRAQNQKPTVSVFLGRGRNRATGRGWEYYEPR